MKKFFLNQNSGLCIKFFSLQHFFLMFITFFIVFLIYKIKNKVILKKDSKKFRYILATILIVNFILRRGSFFYYNVYDYHYHLDINFCNFTSIMFFLYCITANKKIYLLCFYMTFIGPLMAILCPSVNISPLNYSFYSFIILHHMIFIFNILFLYIEDLKFNKKDFKSVALFLIVYFICIYIFNYFMNTSYNAPFSFLNEFIKNTYIVKFLSFNLLSIYLTYLIVIIMLLITGKKALQVLNK